VVQILAQNTHVDILRVADGKSVRLTPGGRRSSLFFVIERNSNDKRLGTEDWMRMSTWLTGDQLNSQLLDGYELDCVVMNDSVFKTMLLPSSGLLSQMPDASLHAPGGGIGCRSDCDVI
jgi:hypothetical protein